MVLDFYAMQRGDRVPPFRFVIDAEQCRAYLEATGEPAEHWGATAPPLALAAFALGGLMEEVPLPFGAVHGGQELEFLRTVPLGAEVSAYVTLVQRGERRGMLVYVFEIELRRDDEAVQHGRTTVIAPIREQLQALS